MKIPRDRGQLKSVYNDENTENYIVPIFLNRIVENEFRMVLNEFELAWIGYKWTLNRLILEF